jgi:predicted RNase H-like nuclease
VRLFGIDGCRAGWVTASSDPGLGALDFQVVPDLRRLVREAAAGRALLAVDIPIGLAAPGPRAADVEARRFLGAPRASSVFPAPARAALAARSYAEACALNFRAAGRRISVELWNILPKIAEADRLVTPALQARVREAHPEVTFAVLAGRGRGLEHPKKTPDGERERLAVLRPLVPAFDPGAVRRALGAGTVARDDIVDAVALLVCAGRIHAGRARVFPSVPEWDRRGLRMEIVA